MMMMMIIIIIIILISFLSTLCRIFKIVYLKQSVFLGDILMQVFHIYNLCYMYCYFTLEICFVLLH